MSAIIANILLFILTMTRQINSEKQSYEQHILSNPFIQNLGSSSNSNSGDRYEANPFLQDLLPSGSERKLTTAPTFSQHVNRVTFHVDDNDYLDHLKKNPFLQVVNKGDSQPTDIVLQTRRPSIYKKPESPMQNGFLLAQFDGTCGLTSPLEQRIVHLIAYGDTVDEHYPWLVAIYRLTRTDPDFICGGTLISEKHVISAAHCFPYQDKDTYQFVITNNLQRDRVEREANDIIRHPAYRENQADADIALVVFNKDVILSVTIRPICLWSEGFNSIRDVIDQKGLIVGWGLDETNQKSKALPKQATLPIIETVDCIRDNGKFAEVLGQKSFCAGYKKDTGACQGDSGSGFIIQKNGRWTLRGIVSSTVLVDKNLCQITDFTAMTDVAKYSSWILKNIAS